jgi:hypothetical protein
MSSIFQDQEIELKTLYTTLNELTNRYYNLENEMVTITLLNNNITDLIRKKNLEIQNDEILQKMDILHIEINELKKTIKIKENNKLLVDKFKVVTLEEALSEYFNLREECNRFLIRYFNKISQKRELAFLLSYLNAKLILLNYHGEEIDTIGLSDSENKYTIYLNVFNNEINYNDVKIVKLL